MVPWEYKAFVPKNKWLTPSPAITRFIPGHDSRLRSTVAFGKQESVAIQIRFSSEMSCDSVASSLKINSTTQDGQTAQLNKSSIVCLRADADLPRHVGEVPTACIFSAELENVSNGVHTLTVSNATTKDGKLSTNVRHLADPYQLKLDVLIQANPCQGCRPFHVSHWPERQSNGFSADG